MANFSNLHIKSAVKAHNKFDLSRTHLTTLDFGQIIPLLAEETVPGDTFNVKGNYFSRMAPLVKPTYGKFSFNTMSVFVPYYQIAEGIDGFFAGETMWHGRYTSIRYISVAHLVQFYLDSAISSSVTASDVATGAWYDITYMDASGTQQYRVFTDLGRYANKVLNSLGYSYPEGVDLRTTSTFYTGYYTKRLSALPFIAFFKAYNDWMSQSQAYNFTTLTTLLEDIKEDINGTYYSSSSHQLNASGMKLMFQNLQLCYENDYFTSAWSDPNRPAAVSNAYTAMNVPSNANNVLTNNSTDNYLALTSSSAQGMINQRSLDFLKAFDDWVRRNNYTGSRAVEQVYSRFGIKTEDYKSNYAHVIDVDKIPVQVGDVTALSQDYVSAGADENVQLGDYSGKGIVSGENAFSYKANDYGMLFVFGWYTVAPMNAFGVDRHVLRTDHKDFFNPEFDGLGADAISVGEMFTNPRITGVSADPQDDATFGFTERYNSYKYGRDKITGDFRKYTLRSSSTYATSGTDENCWHTGRMLTDVRTQGVLVAQNPNVMLLSNTSSEFNRIFSVDDAGVDHFYMTAQFLVSAVRPMVSLNQAPRLGEGDTVVPRNGNEIQ